MSVCEKLIVMASVSLLAGCGGGGSGGGASFESISSKGQALLSAYGTAPVTTLANMPTTGTATYHGAAAYSTNYSTAAGIAQYATSVSDVELNANFGTSTITGTADNFKTSVEGVSLSGSMNVNGTIVGNQFSSNVSGTVTESGAGLTVPVVYNGTVNGEFVGANAEGLRGLGSATGNAGIYGSQNVYVLFGAERE